MPLLALVGVIKLIPQGWGSELVNELAAHYHDFYGIQNH